MWHRAKILSRRQLSPTVTGLTLQVDTLRGFLPGQWLDFRPCPSPTWKYEGEGKVPIGGYSITSVPRSLPKLDLAVQSSRHPVAAWIASHANPSDVVDVRVGGTFTYRSEDSTEEGTTPNRLLFIAGGVGINPLFSMIQQWHAEKNEDSRAVLLYSARKRQDLLFLTELDTLARKRPHHFRVVCSITYRKELSGTSDNRDARDTDNIDKDTNISFREGRLESEAIKDAICWLNNNVASDAVQSPTGNARGQDTMIADDVFVCGPLGMPESVIKFLTEENPLVRSTDDIHFEKWW